MANDPLHQLELAMFDPILGAGAPLWLANGDLVRRELDAFARSLERDYEHVMSPPIARPELYRRSGHLERYADAMFPMMERDGEQLVLRPMNCPHHILVYRRRPRLASELPVRIAECAAMFRYELSGALRGLHRVRCINLNDGHLFVRPDQIASEIAVLVEQVRIAYRALGIDAAYWRLSLRDESDAYVGSDELWADAERALRAAADDASIEVVEARGEAAFYGPKLDVQVIDGQGREESLSTIQLDFNLPERFDLRYRVEGQGWQRPVLIHRSILSSMERLVAHLLDVHGVDLPMWLAPVQLVVAPINEQCEAWAIEVAALARASGIRANVELSGALGAKLKRARAGGVPVVAVIGAREAASGMVAVRRHGVPDADPSDARSFLEDFTAVLGRRQVRW
jgi:threonyl-tRNA synthetase